MPSKEPEWTTVDELRAQAECLSLIRAAIRTLEQEPNQTLVAHKVFDRSLEMRSFLLSVLCEEPFKDAERHLSFAIENAPRPTMGVFGPLE